MLYFNNKIIDILEKDTDINLYYFNYKNEFEYNIKYIINLFELKVCYHMVTYLSFFSHRVEYNEKIIKLLFNLYENSQHLNLSF
jgi:hypothetical protein